MFDIQHLPNQSPQADWKQSDAMDGVGLLLIRIQVTLMQNPMFSEIDLAATPYNFALIWM